MNFEDLSIKKELAEALHRIGIDRPTEVQSLSIKKILDFRNLVIESNTGSGKTMAFLIPVINRIMDKKEKNILVLAPTRELVIQISQNAQDLVDRIAPELIDISILPIYGGKNIKSQINRLRSESKIIVATPGRLLDHMQRQTVDLGTVSTVVIDEVDQMLLMGFRNEVEAILKETENYRQVLFLSATVDSKVKKLAYRYAKDLEIISADTETGIPDTIEQKFVMTTDRKKLDDLCREIDKDRPFMAIIFCRTKARVDNLEMKLGQRGYNCARIHSDISQAKRERILKDFRNMKIQFLISTDLASRGLDIEGVTNIYNYDLPERVEDYVHRIGRTGRLNRDGKSTTFVTDKNTYYEEFRKELEKF